MKYYQDFLHLAFEDEVKGHSAPYRYYNALRQIETEELIYRAGERKKNRKIYLTHKEKFTILLGLIFQGISTRGKIIDRKIDESNISSYQSTVSKIRDIFAQIKEPKDLTYDRWSKFQLAFYDLDSALKKAVVLS